MACGPKKLYKWEYIQYLFDITASNNGKTLSFNKFGNVDQQRSDNNIDKCSRHRIFWFLLSKLTIKICLDYTLYMYRAVNRQRWSVLVAKHLKRHGIKGEWNRMRAFQLLLKWVGNAHLFKPSPCSNRINHSIVLLMKSRWTLSGIVWHV